MNIESYETVDEKSGLMYSFISRGKVNINKLVVYQYLGRNLTIADNSLELYNLGFGDWVQDTYRINDKVNSNNGDTRKVFNTVLNTIPDFFEKNENTALLVSGSDERRLRIYCGYVSKHLHELELTYRFYGFSNDKLVRFQQGNLYDSVVFFPKTS